MVQHDRRQEDRDIDKRLRKTETGIARIEEQTKTIFSWMESHDEQDKSHYENSDKSLNELNKKLDSLNAAKNKWGGIILALSFVGGVALTLSGQLMSWIHDLFVSG